MCYKSDFKYIPNPNQSPCFKVIECHHKQLTHGFCRNSCTSYNDYENAKKDAEDKKNKFRVISTYHRIAMEHQEDAKR